LIEISSDQLSGFACRPAAWAVRDPLQRRSVPTPERPIGLPCCYGFPPAINLLACVRGDVQPRFAFSRQKEHRITTLVLAAGDLELLALEAASLTPRRSAAAPAHCGPGHVEALAVPLSLQLYPAIRCSFLLRTSYRSVCRQSHCPIEKRNANSPTSPGKS
jgi:hypothetical protein